MNDPLSVRIDNVRLSYVHLLKPYAMTQGGEEKYSTTILVPKTDVAAKQAIDAAIEAAKAKGASDKWGGVVPPVVPIPVYDGDGVRPSDGMPFGAECKGHWVFTASSKIDYPPQVVDTSGNFITNQSDVYSGMYANVYVTFFPYLFGGSKKGIGCSLGPVMKVADGEPLGGSAPTASQVFGVQPTVPQAANVFGTPVQQSQAINPITGMPM